MLFSYCKTFVYINSLNNIAIPECFSLPLHCNNQSLHRTINLSAVFRGFSNKKLFHDLTFVSPFIRDALDLKLKRLFHISGTLLYQPSLSNKLLFVYFSKCLLGSTLSSFCLCDLRMYLLNKRTLLCLILGGVMLQFLEFFTPYCIL